MLTPILFLDIDGVLNSAEYFKRVGFAELDRNCINMLDPIAVALLEDIVKRSGAQVVISSSWRIVFSLPMIAEALGHHGFTGSIIGMTGTGGRFRGDQIQAWLDAEKRPACRMVILDDDSDMVHLEPWHVKTSWARGLLSEHVQPSLESLSS